MKKILALTLSLILAGAMFTACGGGKDSSIAETTAAPETTTTATTAETTTVSETVTEALISDGTTAAPAVENPLASFGEVIEKSTEWPALMEVATTDYKDVLLIDPANPNYKAVLAKMAMISAASGQYVIIEAVEGKVDDAVKDLEAYKKKLIEKDAFYPAQKEDAEKAIIGKVGNYAYFIAFAEASVGETALKEALAK